MSGLAVACGGSLTWDPSEGGAANQTGPAGTGMCGTCTSNEECQSNCTNSSNSIYCCDVTTSIGGMGLCYPLVAPANTCPVITASPVDAGRRDAGKVDAAAAKPVDAGAPRNPARG